MKKGYLLIIIVCIITVVLGILFFFMLNSQKPKEMKIVTKNELLGLFDLNNFDCDILSIKVDEKEADDEVIYDTTTITIELSVSSENITRDERFNNQYQDDNAYEHIFDQFSFSIQQFDAIGSFFKELSVQERKGKTLHIPYEIWWGISYNSNDTCNMVAFAHIPQKIALDIEPFLEKGT